jgi:hypothetical protein
MSEHNFPDSNTRRFHIGNACQWTPPEGEPDVEPAELLEAHRRTIHAPGSDPEPAVGPQGLVWNAETGQVEPLVPEGAPSGPPAAPQGSRGAPEGSPAAPRRSSQSASG